MIVLEYLGYAVNAVLVIGAVVSVWQSLGP